MRIHVREPAGERDLELPMRIGGNGACDVRVPGSSAVEGVCLELHDDVLRLRVDGDVAIRINGGWMAPGAFREPRAGDVLFVGDARVCFAAVGEILEVQVEHQAGNHTIEPVRAITEPHRDEQGDEEITPADLPPGTDVDNGSSLDRGWRQKTGWIVAALALVVLLVLAFSLKRISIDIDPSDARVRASGISWHSGNSLFALPGERMISAKRDGYAPYRQTHRIAASGDTSLRIRLAALPGRLLIDTAGVNAEVFVDGAPAGRAPGEIAMRAGIRSVTLRAPRHLDATRRIVVRGAGVRESLKLDLQSIWGRVVVSATTPGARLSVDAGAPVTLPATLDLPAGIHRLTIRAEGARPWQGAVLVKANDVLRLGPITLGAPDAQLRLDSTPRGADVTIAGTFRGRTPLDISLTAGLPQDITLDHAGYGTVKRQLTPAAGQRLVLNVELPVVAVPIFLQGRPAEAEVLVDGVARGKTPLTLSLPATRHTLEIRAARHQSFKTDVDLSSAVARTLDYELTPEGRPTGWKPPSARFETPMGISLRLLPAGTYMLGSERREQGRRANEFSRTVTFERPAYMSTREITNAQFRAFRAEHASGFVDKRSIDLDAMPVTNVTWLDAVQYCNWLSEREGLVPAYEQRDGKWLLRQPVTTGYRLPTESEWELAARFAGNERKLRRYEWGEALPPPAGGANLAGSEAATSLPAVLDGWQDEYPSVAPVGKFAANWLGLQDLLGNVSEWVNDVYASFDSAGTVKDFTGPIASGARHVIKGGNWRTATFADLRAAWRDSAEAATQDIGFRVARYAE